MGMDFRVYLGPCLEVPFVAQEQRDKRVSCPNGHALSSLDAKFCPQCGAPVATESRAALKVKALSPYDLPSEYSNLAWAPDSLHGGKNSHSIWLPNLNGFGRTIDSDGSDDLVVLNAQSVEDALVHFKKNYQALIEYVEKTHGIELRTSYAAVPYWG